MSSMLYQSHVAWLWSVEGLALLLISLWGLMGLTKRQLQRLRDEANEEVHFGHFVNSGNGLLVAALHQRLSLI